MTPCIDYSFLLRNKSFVTCVLVFVVTKLSIVYSLPPYVAPVFYFVIFSSLFFLFSLPFVLLQLHQYVALLLANFDNLCPCFPSVPFFCSSFTSIVLIFLPCSPLVPSSGSFHLPSCDYFSLFSFFPFTLFYWTVSIFLPCASPLLILFTYFRSPLRSSFFAGSPRVLSCHVHQKKICIPASFRFRSGRGPFSFPFRSGRVPFSFPH